MFLLKCGNTDLPGPVKMSVSDEIIWSSDTGRTLDGTMMGDVVAEKKNLKIDWSWLTAQQELPCCRVLSNHISGLWNQCYDRKLSRDDQQGCWRLCRRWSFLL